jgi:hypothetical protein
MNNTLFPVEPTLGQMTFRFVCEPCTQRKRHTEFSSVSRHVHLLRLNLVLSDCYKERNV